MRTRIILFLGVVWSCSAPSPPPIRTYTADVEASRLSAHSLAQELSASGSDPVCTSSPAVGFCPLALRWMLRTVLPLYPCRKLGGWGLVPQPHGGALRVGNPDNAGGGRAAAERRRARAERIAPDFCFSPHFRSFGYEAGTAYANSCLPRPDPHYPRAAFACSTSAFRTSPLRCLRRPPRSAATREPRVL